MPAIAKGKFFFSMSLQISRPFVIMIPKEVLPGLGYMVALDIR